MHANSRTHAAYLIPSYAQSTDQLHSPPTCTNTDRATLNVTFDVRCGSEGAESGSGKEEKPEKPECIYALKSIGFPPERASITDAQSCTHPFYLAL